MNIGISTPLPAYKVNAAFVASTAEKLGFESIWYAEHPILPVHTTSRFPGSDDGEIPWTYAHFADPYIALAQASGATTTIKLGTGITLIPERNPLILAKTVSTLDLFSGGRFILGVGTGWLREETEMMGGDFDHRWSQTKESLLALKELWMKDEAEFHGKYYDFPPVKMFPKPAQVPHPPILIGGMAKNVLRRIADVGDGWLPNRVSPQDVESSRKQLDSLATERGRNPSSITISVYGQLPDRQSAADFVNAGADRVIVRPDLKETESEVASELERIADKVL
ncbi:MAG: LLM class F420-dependent oxidoreductase [Dehalococcoidia bacterium]|nr:LLM class F420-dependent oxidoreductase [Dehalococcoidia bacterium]